MIRLAILLLATLSISGNAYQYETAICAIFQNEAKYMKEWLEYHALIGIEHFYLYNNSSEDNFLEILGPYIEKGKVEVLDWSFPHSTLEEWNKIQCAAYQNCIEKARHATKWLALIDLDEFIVLVKDKTLKKLLKRYNQYSGLSMNWQSFGTSGVESIPSGKLMIEMLTKKASKNHETHLLSKCIIQPLFASHVINPHWVFFHQGYKVNPNKKRCDYHATPYPSLNLIYLNHYAFRDRDYLLNVKYPRLKKLYPDFTLEQLLKRDDEFNQEQDESMKKIIPKLKAKMA